MYQSTCNLSKFESEKKYQGNIKQTELAMKENQYSNG